MFLGFGAGIIILASGIDTALVTDANRTVVVVSGVGAACRFWQKGDDIAIHTDVIVIRNLTVFRLACCNQVLHTVWAVAARGGAVYNQKFYCVVI